MLQFTKKTSAFLLMLLASIFANAQSNFVFPENVKHSDYMEKTIIVKVLPQYRQWCSVNTIAISSFNQLYNTIGGVQLMKKFPNAKQPEKMENERGERLVDLTLMYEFKYSSSVSLEKVINKFIGLRLFEYVEPHYIPQLAYTPNDASFGNQWYMTNIKAENAWGVNTTTARGDTNVVIGITDTGVELLHNDLRYNIKYNYADPINGADDDGDGFIDNFRGWDVGMADNDPTWQGNAHGVHVSGIAAASTNNGIGVAGVGFNCKFLPVKIANAAGSLTAAYEGITYAADHGCAVINCSWGGAGGGQFGQDVINYATFNKNALVVAAAGNNGIDEAFYPAAYQYVISVSNTKTDDRRSASSNYNYTVDVGAPGEGIYSTYSGGGYMNNTGTSMSSPCAAGVAAIIKSFYPSYTALQVGERLKTTTDPFPSQSPIYNNKLGTGRVNMFKAITNPLSPSVLMNTRAITDNNDNTFVIGDTLRMRGTYTNYLGATTNLIATLTSTSGFVTVIDGTTTLGAIATLGTADNNADPFTIKINVNTPQNFSVPFKITYTDAATGYTAAEFFNVVVNVDYVNITINDVATSIGSNGRVGYSQYGQAGGLGFNYMGAGSLLYEAGLMIGTSINQVSDGVRGSGAAADADFVSISSARQIIPAVYSEFDVDGRFNDAGSANPIPVSVGHKAFAWSTAGNRKYVIIQYDIKNTGASTLSNLYAGIFADWDIDAATYGSNRAEFDAANKMGYAYYTGTAGKYCGIKLLTSTAPVVHYAVDNFAGGGGGADLSDGYTTDEKYLTLSTNRANAGMSGAGADVIDVVSSGPFTIIAGDSVRVAFALIAGDDLTDIQTSAGNAQVMYDGLFTTNVSANTMIDNTVAVYPNPTSGNSVIAFTTSQPEMVNIKLYDITGKELKVIASEKVQQGAHAYAVDFSSFADGVYYYSVTVGSKTYNQKLMITK
ncbi:MAG: S8 family peptidase [Bacteroidia bacterium]|nr:S8 family peptidase [Bacteroidia bacterium]